MVPPNRQIVRIHARRFLSTLPSRLLWEWPAWLCVPVVVTVIPLMIVCAAVGIEPPGQGSPLVLATAVAMAALLLYVPWRCVLLYVLGTPEPRPTHGFADLALPTIATARGPFVLLLRGFGPERDRACCRETRLMPPRVISPRWGVPDGDITPPRSVEYDDYAPRPVETALSGLLRGKSLALVNRDDRRPSPGICYVVSDESDWERVVRELIGRASCIVVDPAGGGRGVAKELAFIVELCAQHKTVVASHRSSDPPGELAGAARVTPDADSLRRALLRIAPQLFELPEPEGTGSAPSEGSRQVPAEPTDAPVSVGG